MITDNDKGGNKIVASGKIIDKESVKDTENIKIKQTTLDKAPTVLDNNKLDQSKNTTGGNISMLTNNDKGVNEIVARRKIIDEEIIKDTKHVKIKQNTLDKPPNLLDYNKSDQSKNASEVNNSMITNNDKGGNELLARGKKRDDEIEKDTTHNKIKQTKLDKASNVLDKNRSDQSNNAYEGNASTIINNDKGFNTIVARRKVIGEEIAKDTTNIKIK